MNQRTAEKLFVLVLSNIEKTYEEECNMAIDVFLEEDFTEDELKRMLVYLLEKVKDERYDTVKERIEKELGVL